MKGTFCSLKWMNYMEKRCTNFSFLVGRWWSGARYLPAHVYLTERIILLSLILCHSTRISGSQKMKFFTAFKSILMRKCSVQIYSINSQNLISNITERNSFWMAITNDKKLYIILDKLKHIQKHVFLWTPGQMWEWNNLWTLFIYQHL